MVLRGPQVGPLNLAGVLPWIHWRGADRARVAGGRQLVLLCLSVYAAPLRRPPVAAWRPGLAAAVANKWPAVRLLGLFLWSYEALALWDSPWWTAWIAIGYFVAAFAIDSWFSGGSFCKYACPIGQFHFANSLVSPLTVAIREPATCASASRTIAWQAGPDCQVANCICCNPASKETWTARFVSISPGVPARQCWRAGRVPRSNPVDRLSSAPAWAGSSPPRPGGACPDAGLWRLGQRRRHGFGVGRRGATGPRPAPMATGGWSRPVTSWCWFACRSWRPVPRPG